MKLSEWLEKKFVEWMNKSGKFKSQREFAEWLGMDPVQLNHYLNDRRIPTGANVHKIAERLGPEVYDLLGLSRPDPLIQYITRNWDKLPPDEQEYIRKKVERYADESAPKPTPNPAQQQP